MHNQNASRDFSKRTLKVLSQKGIKLIGKQAVPANENDKYFSGTAYKLQAINEDVGFLRTWHQVQAMACSSWNLKVYLEDLSRE